jgi:hypothetical protein
MMAAPYVWIVDDFTAQKYDSNRTDRPPIYRTLQTETSRHAGFLFQVLRRLLEMPKANLSVDQMV